MKQFLREHIHDDDEARAIVDGCGYFDVKDSQDVWIRIGNRSNYFHFNIIFELKPLRFRNGLASNQRQLQMFSSNLARFREKPYFWISFMIFRYYPLIHF